MKDIFNCINIFERQDRLLCLIFLNFSHVKGYACAP
jgi:hypothetical protein